MSICEGGIKNEFVLLHKGDSAESVSECIACCSVWMSVWSVQLDGLFVHSLIGHDRFNMRSGVHIVFSECSICMVWWVLMWLVAVVVAMVSDLAVVDGVEGWFIRGTNLHLRPDISQRWGMVIKCPYF